jgi:hypothetical protein
MANQEQEAGVAILSTTINTEQTAYVDWAAVIAGGVLAAAISFVLLTFGTGIGLSITSPYPPESLSASTFAIILALWILIVTIISFLAGGYFAGLLMRRRVAGDHEREMRDGMHGMLTWAIAVILGALLTALSVAGAARTGGETANNMSMQAATGDLAPTAYFADVLLRSDNPATVAPAETADRRNEVSRIFMRNPKGEIAPDDRVYLSKVLMHQSGMSEADAKARVDAVINDYRSAITKAQEAVEKARKFALFLAFAVAGALAAGAAMAWWAAVQGGEHRDQRLDFRPHIGWGRKGWFDRTSSSP